MWIRTNLVSDAIAASSRSTRPPWFQSQSSACRAAVGDGCSRTKFSIEWSTYAAGSTGTLTFRYRRDLAAAEAVFVVESTSDCSEPESWVTDPSVVEQILEFSGSWAQIEIVTGSRPADTPRFFRQKLMSAAD